MDELTFLSGCVLAGMVAAGPDAYVFDDEATVLLKTMRRLASMHLGRVERKAMQRAILRGDVPPDPADPGRPSEDVAPSDRDVASELSAIIEAVDVAGWQTQEAKADGDVVSWVRDMAVERDRLKQLHHNKCIDAAQDAAENEVLKSRNAELRARQVRLLAALARAVAVVRYVAAMPVPRDFRDTAHWQELIELIDLLKLECKPDEAA